MPSHCAAGAWSILGVIPPISAQSGFPDLDQSSVALQRSDRNTHSFAGGDGYVKLAFEVKDDDDNNGNGRGSRKLRVVAPDHPAQVVPGVYMLFVIDRSGVPSVGSQLRIEPSEWRTTRLRTAERRR